MIKVSVVGAKGRMGSHVVEAVNNAEDTQLALALDAGDDLTQITTDNTDVVVEFTVPSVSLNPSDEGETPARPPTIHRA